MPTGAWAHMEATLARGSLDQQSEYGKKLTPGEAAALAKWKERIAAFQLQILALVRKQNRTRDEATQLELLLKKRREASEKLASLAVAASSREVASSEAIQPTIAADTALLYWVDLSYKRGIIQACACIVRRNGEPKWVRLPGTGEDGKWSMEDTLLLAKLRSALRGPTATSSEIETLVAKARAQRIAPIEKHLQGVNRLLVIGVGEMAGIPVELLAPKYQIEYVTSGTALARAAAKPKFAGSSALLALGDPVFKTPDPLKEPPLPPSGILVVNVVPGGAAGRAIMPGDVLLSYGGTKLSDVEGLGKAIAAKAKERTIPVELWRVTEDGKAITKTVDLAPGRLGVNIAKEPAHDSLAARHKTNLLLAASNRSGRIDPRTGAKAPWNDLPGTAVELDRLKKAFGEQATILARSSASEQKLEELARPTS